MYSVKEIFLSLQGEGVNTGRTAVFCRFAGCNLWSGRERDRTAAACRFCDTDFVGVTGLNGGKYPDAESLAAAISTLWPSVETHRLVVLTGGEPLLQLDAKLIDALHAGKFMVAVETNGALPAPANIDWLCVSPKAGVMLKQQSGHELKLVYPQHGIAPYQLEHLHFQHFLLQPLDNENLKENVRLTIQYCLEHPCWRLSPQIHKLLGIP